LNFHQANCSDSTSDVNSDGNIFIEGKLSTIFQAPCTSPAQVNTSRNCDVFECLERMLLPRIGFHRIRMAESSQQERDLYELQDHAHQLCKIDSKPVP
jgi:hypothetical protein